MDDDELFHQSTALMSKIGKVCQGEEMQVVMAALLRVTAKMTSISKNPAAINEIVETLKRLHQEEVEEIRNAN